VLGISPDPEDALKSWQELKNLPFDLLSDPNHRILEAWGAWGEKMVFGNKSMGVIRSHWVIDENGIVVDEQINISPDDSVRKAVEALG
jgi:peroxiredoxin Q/BCP